MFNYKRVAALESGIARLFKQVYRIDDVLRPGGFFDDSDNLQILNRWLEMIEAAHKNTALENKIKSVVQENCPAKKKK